MPQASCGFPALPCKFPPFPPWKPACILIAMSYTMPLAGFCLLWLWHHAPDPAAVAHAVRFLPSFAAALAVWLVEMIAVSVAALIVALIAEPSAAPLPAPGLAVFSAAPALPFQFLREGFEGQEPALSAALS